VQQSLLAGEERGEERGEIVGLTPPPTCMLMSWREEVHLCMTGQNANCASQREASAGVR